MHNKEHWESIFSSKSNNQMSWFQQKPTLSLEFLKLLSVAKDAAIIDIGGGDSLFVDFVLALGYTNITVLDISERAIERAQERLGLRAKNVKWIISDILDFKPQKSFDFWHDRAVFHFLTTIKDIESYTKLVHNSLHNNAKFILGTFAENGPDKCSGLAISKYSEEKMALLFQFGFDKIKCIEEEHTTPFHTTQAFIFCSFNKLAA